MRIAERLAVLGLCAFVAWSVPSAADAQSCLPTAARAAFRASLVAQLRASQSPIAQLYRHTYDRLGFGPAPHRALGTVPASGDPIEALADQIVGQLAGTSTIRTNIDDILASLPRATTPPNVVDLSPNPLRHVGGTMTTAYSELQGFARRITELRRRITPLPPGAARDRLQAELDTLSRTAVLVRNESRDAASARTIGQAALSANGAFGALMTEFWWNHFNVDADKVSWAAVDYQKALQTSACGTFEALLVRSAKHPAMAMYLDNFRSQRGAINENYGRELLELHTLGDDLYRFYDQNDVVGVARALTGWGIQFIETATGTIAPSFVFRPGAHDNAALTLFVSAPRGVRLDLAPIAGADGVRRGEALLRYLANHAATRRNICAKLSRKLIGDAPNAIVTECASDGVWGTGGGDLAAIYRYFLLRPEMWQASSADNARVPTHPYVAKDKTPFELYVSAARAAELPTAAFDHAWFSRSYETLRNLGLLPARTPPPTGYPDGNVWTTSGLMLSWNQALFQAVPTTALALRDAQGTLIGDRMEAHFGALVRDANGSAARLRAIGRTVGTSVLRVPGSPIAESSDTVHPALVDADVSRTTRVANPARSYVHALLAHGTFLRK
jgi:uncharacterized protein (DUF1800 family)